MDDRHRGSHSSPLRNRRISHITLGPAAQVSPPGQVPPRLPGTNCRGPYSGHLHKTRDRRSPPGPPRSLPRERSRSCPFHTGGGPRESSHRNRKAALGRWPAHRSSNPSLPVFGNACCPPHTFERRSGYKYCASELNVLQNLFMDDLLLGKSLSPVKTFILAGEINR